MLLDTHHKRQWSENFSRSFLATPSGVVERFRADGGGVGRMFRGVLALPGYEADVGDVKRDLIGLVGGDDTEVAEGKSYRRFLSLFMIEEGLEDPCSRSGGGGGRGRDVFKAYEVPDILSSQIRTRSPTCNQPIKTGSR